MDSFVASSILSGVVVGMIYSLVALGCVIIFKSTRVVSFTQGGILFMGALIGWALLDIARLPAALALVITMACCSLIGVGVERFALRPLIGQPLLSSVMVTIAVAWLLDSIGTLTIGGEGRAYPPIFGSELQEIGWLDISRSHMPSFVSAIVLYIAFMVFYRYTKLGLAMRGAAEDHEVVQSLGIRVTNIFSQTWLIAALTAGIAGFFMASIVNVYVGLSSFGWKGLIVILIGGLESIPGAIIVGPAIGIFENLSALYLDPLVGGGMREVAPFVAMIIMLLIRPSGLFGLKRIERV